MVAVDGDKPAYFDTTSLAALQASLVFLCLHISEELVQRQGEVGDRLAQAIASVFVNTRVNSVDT
jgi:hypothetical protein